MGTHTDFTGAIRITPCVSEPLATKLQEFMDIRHMRRNVEQLYRIFPDPEERKELSLFSNGDFGEEGAFFLPRVTKDFFPRPSESGPYPEAIDEQNGLNMPPEPCPSLYCDLNLLHDEKRNCSYLGWNEAEKSYYITDWIELIASWLVPRGYHMDGKMFAVVEGGMSFYSITVQDAEVTSEEFEPDVTYWPEFNELLYEN